MIRRAEQRDADAILSLLSQVGMVHHRLRPDIFKEATKYTHDELLCLIKEENTPVFVATDDSDIPKGYAFCVLTQTDGHGILTDIKTLYIDDLCVDEKERGKHIGSALYAYVLDFAKAQGCYNVTLNVWEGNAPAIAFYEAKGMKKQKTVMETILL